MRVKQVSVFAENRSGRLGDILSTLADVGVDMRALSIADSNDFGIVRMILSDTAKGQAALKEAGFTLIVNDVLAVEVPDVPGGFYKAIVAPLMAAGVNIEYVYAFAERPQEHALVVLKTSDLAKAEAIIS